jgi:hypothetical protein
MGKIKQLWRCPDCSFETNYRGSCKDCSDTEANVWVQRERINADGSPYEKKLVSSTKGIDPDQMRAAFKASRSRQKKTRKQIAAQKKIQEAELEALKAAQAEQKTAEGSEHIHGPDCDHGSPDEIVFGVSEEE